MRSTPLDVARPQPEGFAWARRVDAVLLRVPRPAQYLSIAATLAWMLLLALPEIPREYADFSRVAWLPAFAQPAQYGPDTIAGIYASKVILNDPSDMYTRMRLEQTPLETATWSKEASGPYPPTLLLSGAALYAAGESLGIGFYGALIALFAVFIGLSITYCLRTRWYVFPLLYANFFYFAHRFFAVQDATYLIMLTVAMVALQVAARRPAIAHALVGLAITMKLSPVFYVTNLARMSRRSAIVVVAILVAGLILPIAIWDRYLSIYAFHETFKGTAAETVGAMALSIPFSLCVWYVEARLGFDWEDRVGWGLVPFALFLGFKMNTARHLLVVLLVPDKRVLRNLALAVGMLVPTALPGLVRFNSALAITAALLVLSLVYYLDRIGWRTVRADLASPRQTLRLLLGSPRVQAQNSVNSNCVIRQALVPVYDPGGHV